MSRKRDFTEKDLERFKDRQDDLNPCYVFSLTATRLLCESLKGEFDMDYLVRRELANRGLNKEGIWVGFENARKLHKTGNE